MKQVKGIEAKYLYREQYDRDKMPLSYAPWLLDAAYGELWEIVCVVEQDRVRACFIYHSMRRRFMTIESYLPHIGESPLWICSLEGWSDQEKVFKELEWINMLLEGLPSYDHMCILLPSNLSNWLPFYWRGFGQRTMYSFELDLPLMASPLKSIAQVTIRPWSITEVDDLGAKFMHKRLLKYIDQNKKWLVVAEQHDQLLGVVAVDSAGHIVALSFVLYHHGDAYEWYESSLKGEMAKQVRMQILESWKQQLDSYTTTLYFENANHLELQHMYRQIGAVPVRRLIVEHTTSLILGMKQFFSSNG